ncbi:MAG: hypothetical protein IPK37_12340 [Austwickia sp.]|nr:MAG: hypothetical protein IPK37_12340 [Austwickia sp.]
MNAHRTLATLATAAALGTSTRPITADALPEPLAALVAPVAEGPEPSLADASASALLLDAAAAVALVRRSSIPAATAVPALALPPASRPPVPREFVALLHRIRESGWAAEPLQAEALSRAAERGFTLPPALLFDLLADAHRPAIARTVAALLDDRGRALVALDSTWSKHLARAGAGPTGAGPAGTNPTGTNPTGTNPTGAARAAPADSSDAVRAEAPAAPAGPADPDAWDRGTLAERLAHLARVRRVDPPTGLALLDGPGWARETADAREQFVRTLTIGLSDADEPFLERLLDDRALSVRRAAADALARLPHSAYVSRAHAHVRAHLTLRTRLLRQATLMATGVPATAATTRDLYPPGGPDRTRLVHACSIVPPSHWVDLLGTPAADLARIPAEIDGGPLDLTDAWAAAAERWSDADLARVVLRGAPAQAARLLPVLPDPERAAWVGAALRQRPAAAATVLPLLPDRLDARGTADLTHVVRDWLGTLTTTRYQLPDLLRRLAMRADLSIAPDTVAHLQALHRRLAPQESAALHRAFGEAAAALQLRRAIADVLTAHSSKQPTPARGEKDQP